MRALLLVAILLPLLACTATYGPGEPDPEPPVPEARCDPDDPDCSAVDPLCTDPSDYECNRL